ncbi:hypothetical protein HK096_008918 [Nowakowskiella sp. JEL0078]|nr:hypothetical protein HK096_008918 [Nowakowskiella sp. JEL0078]
MSSAVALPLTNPAGFSEVGYASTGFLVWGAALVFFMIPGLGLVYSGLSRGKNALTMVTVIMAAASVVTLQWILWGYSLAFSETGGVFIGNFAYIGFTSIGSQPLSTITTWVPAIAFGVYQMQFAAITPAIIFGSAAERFSILPALIFTFIWATLIYDPIAYWTWAAKGWIHNMACISDAAAGTPCLNGGLDFAGGGPVHISSGFAGLAYALVLGKRKVTDEPHRPHNLNLVILGTSMLWFGWFGFNGGSAVAATSRAAMAATVTTVATAAAALSWALFDYTFTKKFSAIGFCSGAIAGLVGITPASGFVAPWAAIIIGAVTSIICNLACRLKNRLGYDDALDAFGLHGIGGFVGNILTGIFAQKWIALLDGTVILGGWVEGNWIQVAYQFAGSGAIAAYAFVGTYIICIILNFIPGLKLRVEDHHEEHGIDVTQMGEVAYDHYDETIPETKEAVV